MIQEYILKPFLDTIIENSQFNDFIELMIIIILGFSFLMAIERGVLYVWQKLYINF